MEFINYAHRGASEYAPENTSASFSLAHYMGANGVETDIQKTKDGVLVLFHDNDLMRICSLPHSISDLTYPQLQALDFGIYKGKEFKGTGILTFKDFLVFYASKFQFFAIEIKERGIEEEVIRLIEENLHEKDVVVTSGIWSALTTVRRINPSIKTGYLAKFLSQELLEEARKEGIWQICPKASILTDEWNERIRKEGFSVRAWGVDSVETMNNMLDKCVDGMTINFPEKLVKEIKERKLS